jgi:hypothetical protein
MYFHMSIGLVISRPVCASVFIIKILQFFLTNYSNFPYIFPAINTNYFPTPHFPTGVCKRNMLGLPLGVGNHLPVDTVLHP